MLKRWTRCKSTHQILKLQKSQVLCRTCRAQIVFRQGSSDFENWTEQFLKYWVDFIISVIYRERERKRNLLDILVVCNLSADTCTFYFIVSGHWIFKARIGIDLLRWFGKMSNDESNRNQEDSDVENSSERSKGGLRPRWKHYWWRKCVRCSVATPKNWICWNNTSVQDGTEEDPTVGTDGEQQLPENSSGPILSAIVGERVEQQSAGVQTGLFPTQSLSQQTVPVTSCVTQKSKAVKPESRTVRIQTYSSY